MAITHQVGMSIKRKWLLLAVASVLFWLLFFIPAIRYPTVDYLVPVIFFSFFSAVVLTIFCFIYAGHVSAHARIRRTLAALPAEYAILHDVRFTCGKTRRLIDHLVIAPSGVWLVKVLPGAHRVFGDEQHAYWSTQLYYRFEVGKRRWQVIPTPNPVTLLNPCCDVLYDLLQREVGGKTPVHLALIYPGTEINITASIPVVKNNEDLAALLTTGDAVLHELDRERIVQTILRQRKHAIRLRQ